MARVVIPLAEGAEEMETVITVDVMRRAKWDVVVAGVAEGPVTASRGVRLVPDVSWADVNPDAFDMIVVPGGNGGVSRLRKIPSVLAAVKKMHADGKWVAAVCAGPLVLQEAGILAGVRATCHPGAADELVVTARQQEPVVVDGQIVTSQGPGTTFPFVLTLVALVDGREKAEAIAAGMVLGADLSAVLPDA